MAIATAFNSTDSPIEIDAEGRTIGGGEWGTVDTTSDLVKTAAETGGLEIYRDLDEGPGQNPDAIEAIRTTRSTQERLEQAQALDRDALDEAATKARLNPENMTKAELAYALAMRPEISLEGSEPKAAEAETEEPAKAPRGRAAKPKTDQEG